MPRIHVEAPLAAGQLLDLPPGAARHVQVLRLQPGAPLTLFNGQGGEWSARVEHIGRSAVQVQVDTHDAVEREIGPQLTIALSMPANDRMDTLVEKAVELGVAAIQPLMSERSVLRLAGERAERKRAHWQGIAVAACEQSGRNRVPAVGPVLALQAWLDGLGDTGDAARWLLGFGEAALPLAQRLQPRPPPRLLLLSGPEGGLSAAEVEAARRSGFLPTSLGPAVLRADTAPLAALAALGLLAVVPNAAG
ncbi:16S rRNA (uracil(1498)-N(3))-methyltransferase [Aquincola sp. J276]|uniref:16S rRNA (uracil(1498)-N(3))-methyltransferase n=1 Tax=Aquincola sp. J276 TaxID=2898432 RepID=UPI002150CA12|nr:16S rRNA (uracil(1498)-N(3))-methyltransferase [Aquincola sp. J276]MCR5866221.1 16S rRNA (uracil(1498)-N(3))-methyltransferase [Aquincola sp. J276]